MRVGRSQVWKNLKLPTYLFYELPILYKSSQTKIIW